MVRPARRSRGTLISSPMMNSRKMSPISDITSMLASSVTTPNPT